MQYMEYEAKVEIYGLSTNDMYRLDNAVTFSRSYGSGPVCWTADKLGWGIQFRVRRDTANEAKEQALIETQLALARLGIWHEGLEATCNVEPRPDGEIPTRVTLV